MHGRIPLLTLLALLLLAAPAAARTRNVDLPRLFHHQIAEIHRADGVAPVLLPQTMPSDFRRHYPSGGTEGGDWFLSIGAVRDCGGATACFVASFSGQRGERPVGRIRVRLRGGRTGYFKALSCGASCSPPSVEWVQRGVLYAIQANVGTRRTEKRILLRMANSAIKHGPR